MQDKRLKIYVSSSDDSYADKYFIELLQGIAIEKGYLLIDYPYADTNRIKKMVSDCDCIIVIWTKFSEWILCEASMAIALDKPVIPILIDKPLSSFPAPLQHIEPLPFSEGSVSQTKSITLLTVQLEKIERDLNSSKAELRDTTTKDKEAITVKPMFGVIPQNVQYQADIFVLMPFREDISPVYGDHIKAVATDMNLTIKRGDDFFTEHSVIKDIWAAINKAQVVIADCTERNPNVFYELGITHTVGKKTILITQNKDDIPFDLSHLRRILYEYTPKGMRQFEKELRFAIKGILGLT